VSADDPAKPSRVPRVEIVLVRHGEPDWEPGGTAVDQPVLTPLGHEQARRAAKALAGERFDAVYVSPLPRASQTAEPILEALGVEGVECPWLAELRLPTLEGLSVPQVREFFARARARDVDQHWEGMADGESFRHFYERVSAGIEGLLTGDHRLTLHENSGHRIWQVPDEAPGRLLIIAHAGTNAVILSHLLGVDPVPWAYLRFEGGWASLSRIVTVPLATGWVWCLESFSGQAHLAGLPETSRPA